MKKKLFLIIFTISTSILSAQNIKVKSFTAIPNDMTARINAPKIDQNGEKCALIKLVTIEKGFVFEGGSLGIVDINEKTGEIWIYIPHGALYLTIKHDRLGVLRNYAYPVSIESAVVYEMELSTNGGDTYPIVINTDPNNIEILLDSIKEQSGTTIPDITSGSHTLDIEYPGFGEVHDTIEVSKNNISFSYKLEALKQIPVRIITQPEGANLMVNNRSQGITPIDVFVFPGKVRMFITHDTYQLIDTVVPISKNTRTLNFTMQSTSGSYDISSNIPGIEILIDDKPAKTGPTLTDEGKHTLSANADGYHSYDTVFTITRGGAFVKKINLIRLTGDLQVTAKPFEAEFELIRINYNSSTGKTTEDVVYSWKGTKLLEDIPTGQYTLRAKHPGYTTENKKINIESEKTAQEAVELAAVTKKTGSLTKSIALSAIMPGAGQIYSKQKRGWIYMPLFIGSLGTSYIFHLDVKEYNDAQEEYLNATSDIDTYREKMDNAYDKAVSSAKTRNLLVYTAGAVYLTSIIDAIIFGGQETKHQAGISKYLNNIHLTSVPVQGIPTYGFSYNF